MKKILVIGGTGMIGKPVVRALLQAGFAVTVLARDTEKARKLFPAATVLKGDVFDPLSLLPAFEGQDAVYISLSPPRTARPADRMPEGEGIDNIIAVAKKTGGLTRLVLLSSLVQRYNGMNGFHWWIFDIKLAAVEKLKQCGIPYTIFYPSSFMECFDQLLLKGRRIMLAGTSKAPMYFIAAEDYGKQVARSFELLTTQNREYIIQGVTAYNWDDGARVFIAHYKKARLKTLKAPLGMLQFLGLFSATVRYGATIMEALNNYPEQFDSAATWQELGKPGITLEAYAERQSAVGNRQ
jgi:uncharacterized protein YbjT (DUF2867 family)